MSKKYVGYYRVSTQRQGKSGLGLVSQQSAVRDFAESKGDLIEEFTEVVSGKSNKHDVLDEAIKLAKKKKATLLVKKLDRFSRRVSFISRLLERGVDLEVVDMPNATTFQIHIYAALAEEERRLISERTKAALKVAKENGVELGKNGKILAITNHKDAVGFAKKTLEVVKTAYRMGSGYSAIARELNNLGIESYRGKKFYAATVRNMVHYLQSEGNLLE